MYLQGFQFGIPPVQAESGQPLWNNAGTLAGMAGVTWDNVNERIGWGTNAPAAVVHAVADSAAEIPLIAQLASSATANGFELRNSAGAVLASLLASGFLRVPANTMAANVAVQVGAAGTGLSAYGGGLQLVIGGAPVISFSGAEAIIQGPVKLDSGRAFGFCRPWFFVKTSDYSLTFAESGSHYSNQGATGQVIFTLPDVYDGDPSYYGYNYDLFVRAAQYLQIKAPSGETIMLNGVESASGGYIRCNTIGAGIHVEKIGVNKWLAYALGAAGTWTIDS